MPLPNPLPDNPNRWDGWRSYNSPNYYDRLGLTFDSNASTEQIEEHCRLLLVWWQKKLPLKSQPSNPLSQMLRAGMDEAPTFLVEARTALLDPELRREHDELLRTQAVTVAIEEFNKLVAFTMADRRLTPEDEEKLLSAGVNLGLSQEEANAAIDIQLASTGSVRYTPIPVMAPAPAPAPVVAPPAPAPVPAPAVVEKDPFEEFRKILRMSRLSLDGDDMTDDQRDAMCNLGESLGLTGGQAEDLIDEYIADAITMSVPAPKSTRPAVAPKPTPARPTPAAKPAGAPAAPAAATPAPRVQATVVTPLLRAQEKEKYPNYRNTLGLEMLLITSGSFNMGSNAPGSFANEHPVTRVNLSRYYMSRFPITNVQYERFDPSHASKRAPWADAQHPVVYVTAKDAERFCEWLSQHERRKYRLPTEAEWEYAARGMEHRIFPWGEVLDSGSYANFADARTAFSWRDPMIDDGWAQTSPVGFYLRGASPFGIEDMAGNVFEWCFDCMDPYKGKEVANPRGPRNTNQRIYRGGSWKSRANSLRTTARAYNSPDFSSNDVGFRIICECD